MQCTHWNHSADVLSLVGLIESRWWLLGWFLLLLNRSLIKVCVFKCFRKVAGWVQTPLLVLFCSMQPSVIVHFKQTQLSLSSLSSKYTCANRCSDWHLGLNCSVVRHVYSYFKAVERDCTTTLLCFAAWMSHYICCSDATALTALFWAETCSLLRFAGFTM